MLDLVERARSLLVGDGLVALADERDERLAAVEQLLLLSGERGVLLRAGGLHERLLAFGTARLGEISLVAFVRLGGHEEKPRSLVERRLLEHALREHLPHVFLHVRNAFGAPLRKLLHAVRIAQTDGFSVAIEGARKVNLASAGEHKRRAAYRTCGDEGHRGTDVEDQHDQPDKDKRNCHSDARHDECYTAAALRRGARIAQVHQFLLALALLDERILFLTSANAVRSLRNPAADAFGGNTGNALDGRLEVAEIARLHGILRSVCNLVGHVV